MAAKAEEITIVVQINGRLRDRTVVPAGMDVNEIKKMALDSERVKKWLENKVISRVVIVPDKLVNIVANMR